MDHLIRPDTEAEEDILSDVFFEAPDRTERSWALLFLLLHRFCFVLMNAILVSLISRDFGVVGNSRIVSTWSGFLNFGNEKPPYPVAIRQVKKHQLKAILLKQNGLSPHQLYHQPKNPKIQSTIIVIDTIAEFHRRLFASVFEQRRHVMSVGMIPYGGVSGRFSTPKV